MSLIGENVAIIGLGVSCQTKKQLVTHIPLLADLTGDETLSVAGMPMDWLISPIRSTISLLMLPPEGRTPTTPNELVVNKRPYWPPHNLYFFHHFRDGGGIEAGPAFDKTSEVFKARWRRFQDVVQSGRRLIFVASNTQIDLSDHAKNTGTFSHVENANHISELYQTLCAITGKDVELLFITHRDRYIEDNDLPAGVTIDMHERLAPHWHGDPDLWAASFRRSIVTSLTP